MPDSDVFRPLHSISTVDLESTLVFNPFVCYREQKGESMKHLFTIAILAAAFVLTGCVSAEYMGKTYPPTDHVDIFFSFDDIDRDYEVMGEIRAEAAEFMSMEKIQAKLMEEAMAKGGDAIVIEDWDKVVVSASTTTQGEADENKYKETTTSTVTEEKVVTAKVVKYK
jgi:hypothetical protein